MRFWINLRQVASKSIDWTTKLLKRLRLNTESVLSSSENDVGLLRQVETVI